MLSCAWISRPHVTVQSEDASKQPPVAFDLLRSLRALLAVFWKSAGGAGGSEGWWCASVARDLLGSQRRGLWTAVAYRKAR